MLQYTENATGPRLDEIVVASLKNSYDATGEVHVELLSDWDSSSLVEVNVDPLATLTDATYQWSIDGGVSYYDFLEYPASIDAGDVDGEFHVFMPGSSGVMTIRAEYTLDDTATQSLYSYFLAENPAGSHVELALDDDGFTEQ